MNGQFYCPQVGKFLPCEEALIGTGVHCPLCGETHDAVPGQTPTPAVEDGLRRPTEMEHSAKVTQPKTLQPQTSGFAISSMILGILGIAIAWFTLAIPSILAVIFGHIARGKIRRSEGAIVGNGMAIAGLVMGYLVFPIAIPFFAATMIPAYQDYTVRAKIHELDTGIRKQVTAYVDRTNRLPSSNPELGLTLTPASEKIVSSLSVDNGGRITITFASPLEGQTLVYEPIKGQKLVDRWVCTGGTLKDKYRPMDCREMLPALHDQQIQGEPPKDMESQVPQTSPDVATDISSQTPQADGSIKTTIDRVRVGNQFDAKEPDIKPAVSWVSQGLQVNFAPPYPGASRLLAGKQTVSSGDKQYTVNVAAFAGEKAIKPSGTYVEIVLSLEASASQAGEFTLVDRAKSLPDIRLETDKNTQLLPRAFLVPNLSLAPASMVIGWEGGLDINLSAGEKTWVVLLFDVQPPVGPYVLKVAEGKTLAVPSQAPQTLSSVATDIASQTPQANGGIKVSGTAQYDGAWKGTTSQGKPIGFMVVNNAITTMTVGFKIQGNSCSSEGSIIITGSNGPISSISGNQFSISGKGGTPSYTLTGTFSSNTAVSGNVQFTQSASPPTPSCSGSSNDTWQVEKVNNTAPVANAGPDQSVKTGTVVSLDGSGSSDANGDTLAYWWSVESKPAGSNAFLSDSTTAKPTFTADVAGTYVAKLVVNDGIVESTPADVTVTAQLRRFKPKTR